MPGEGVRTVLVCGTRFETPWEIGSKVHIDGERDLTGVVTGFMWRSAGLSQVEVSWMHNGAASSAWIKGWRLSGVEK